MKYDVSYENDISLCDKRASTTNLNQQEEGKTTRNDAHLQLIRAII